MNFLGIGLPEMGVILLIAFLVLGPSTSIDMARTAGKVFRDISRIFNDVTAAANLDFKDLSSSSRDSSPRDAAPRDSSPSHDQEDVEDEEDPTDQEQHKLPEGRDE